MPIIPQIIKLDDIWYQFWTSSFFDVSEGKNVFFVWNFCLAHLTAGKIAISLEWKKSNFDTVFTKSVSNQTLKNEITEVTSRIWEGSILKIQTVKKRNPWSPFKIC